MLTVANKEGEQGLHSGLPQLSGNTISHRFEYLTPRLRITPKDFEGNKLENSKIIHFICSPSRASAIMSEVKGDWKPITVYEPIPVRSAGCSLLTVFNLDLQDRCVPEELPALKVVLPLISILRCV
jgi:hypothetical protein